MAVDIIAKLLLQTEDYQNNLKAARSEMKQFEQAGATVKSFLTKMAVSLGAATTATAAFQKIIGSSRTLSKAFGEDMAEAKASVDTFFNSMAIADFSNFTNTMQDAISSAKEFYDQLGKLNTIKVFNSNEVLKVHLAMSKARGVLMDKKSSEEAKKQAKDQLRALNQELLNTSKQLSDQATTTYYADLRARMRSYGVSGNNDSLNNSIDKHLSSYTNYSDAVKRLNELDKQAKSTMQKVYTYSTNAYGSTFSSYKMVATAATKAITNSIEYKTLRAIKEMGNKALTEAKGYESEALTSEINAQDRINANLRKMGAGSKGTGGNTKTKKDIGPVGSDLYIKSEITKLQTEMEKATTDGARFGFQKAIDEFQLTLNRHAFAAKMKPMLDESYYRSFQSKPDLTPKTLKGTLDAGLKPIIKETDVKNTMLYNDALGQTFNTMLAISNVTSKGAAGWISYGVNAMTALNQTYMSLVKVIPALEIKAVAEGAGSAAQAPVVGWIAAIAAIGSMVAAFASLPKYATGGIIDANSGVIPGNQFTGDKILARVNAGELILNKAQQRNIAAQLSADRTQRLDVNIIGRISGRDLEFVLDRRKQYNGYAL